jgi:hypothetical protein
MEPQGAHWYCIKQPIVGGAYCQEIKPSVLSLSLLLNILCLHCYVLGRILLQNTS